MLAMRPEERRALVLEEAAEWLLLLRERPQDADLGRQIDVWRAQSAEHGAAWNKTAAMWRALGAVSPQYERLSPARGEIAPPQRRTRRGAARSGYGWLGQILRPKVAGVAAAIAICGALLLGPTVMLRLQADALTATAETQSVTLEDGSVVALAADSGIKSAFDENRRTVTLLAGEAFFDVTADPRPFVVAAGNVEIKVLGTAFNVRMTSAGTQVALEHGAVTARSNGPSGSQETLRPGEVMDIDHGSGRSTKSTIALADIAGWREGRLYVVDETIGSVVEQIQRYHPAWITLPDRGLSSKRVSGIYDLTNPDQALRALVAPYGGNVRSASPFLRVISRF